MASSNKFWVALIMAAIEFLRVRYDIDPGIDEGTVAGVLGVIGAGLVWLVPNR